MLLRLSMSNPTQPSWWLADGKTPARDRDRFESYDSEGCSNPVQLATSSKEHTSTQSATQVFVRK